MKAIVCDKCGKVVLMSDDELAICPEGINILQMLGKRQTIDLCDECTDELVAAIRNGD